MDVLYQCQQQKFDQVLLSNDSVIVQCYLLNGTSCATVQVCPFERIVFIVGLQLLTFAYIRRNWRRWLRDQRTFLTQRRGFAGGISCCCKVYRKPALERDRYNLYRSNSESCYFHSPLYKSEQWHLRRFKFFKYTKDPNLSPSGDDLVDYHNFNNGFIAPFLLWPLFEHAINVLNKLFAAEMNHMTLSE